MYDGCLNYFNQSRITVCYLIISMNHNIIVVRESKYVFHVALNNNHLINNINRWKWRKQQKCPRTKESSDKVHVLVILEFKLFCTICNIGSLSWSSPLNAQQLHEIGMHWHLIRFKYVIQRYKRIMSSATTTTKSYEVLSSNWQIRATRFD